MLTKTVTLTKAI